MSRIGLVPKKQPGECRMIHHRSYPDGESVNDYIDPEICSVQYTKFDEAVKMIQNLGQGTLLGKADVKNAFRLMIMSPVHLRLLGFQSISASFWNPGKNLHTKKLPRTIQGKHTARKCVQVLNAKCAASSEFGTYRLCEQRRFRRACASAQSRQNLRCSLIQAMSQEEPSDRKPDP